MTKTSAKKPLPLMNRAFLHVTLWLSLVLVRVRLGLFGYNFYQKNPVEMRTKPVPNIRPVYISLVVQRMAKFVPGALCLAQSIVAQRKLARLGLRTTIRIGVKSDDKAQLAAHAWLLLDDRIIMGGTAAQLREYEVLTDIKTVTI